MMRQRLPKPRELAELQVWQFGQLLTVASGSFGAGCHNWRRRVTCIRTAS